ncbi:MAG: hypothetical protein ACRDJW_13935 [Thermomicrobiales bacterium]
MSDQQISVGGIIGSLRARSYNRGLFNAAVELAPAGMTLRELPIGELPHYNQDVEDAGETETVRVNWRDLLLPEVDNIRAAQAWFAGLGDTEAALRLVTALTRLWWITGDTAGALRSLTEYLDRPDPVAPAVRAKALVVAARFEAAGGDCPRGLYLRVDGACPMSRGGNDDRVGAAHRAAGSCQGDRALGESCASPDARVSGHCIDDKGTRDASGVCIFPGNWKFCDYTCADGRRYRHVRGGDGACMVGSFASCVPVFPEIEGAPGDFCQGHDQCISGLCCNEQCCDSGQRCNGYLGACTG